MQLKALWFYGGGRTKEKQTVFPTFCKVTAYRKGGIFIKAFICVCFWGQWKCKWSLFDGLKNGQWVLQAAQ